MDVRLRGSQGKPPTTPSTPKPGGGRLLTAGQVAELLGKKRQRRELRIARSFTECRGLSDEQLEELYQQTTIALLRRLLRHPYQDEKHLCDALHRGIKQRALNLHRDERRHREILASNAPGVRALERARASDDEPEQLALAREDRLVINEFLAELTPQERPVFWLMTEGMKYNRIAKALPTPISVNEARNMVASCERKRERFQLLHDSGRLCGYRAGTIKALLEGQAVSEQLVQLAAAHLQACAHCRAEHKTNAQRLRRAFQRQVAALLPPILATHPDAQTRGIQARLLAQRIRLDWISHVAQSGPRERVAVLLGGGGTSAKLAAGIVTAAVIAGSTIAATHSPAHHRTRPRTHTLARHIPTRRASRTVHVTQTPLAQLVYRQGPVRVVAQARRQSAKAPPREPDGFAYLGVPAKSTSQASTSATAAAVRVPDRATQPVPTVTQTGGPFSP
jgi:RNA polymerase sigma factor (sigma-70 family)